MISSSTASSGGTQPGFTFRLRGKGAPSVNGRGRGDQYVIVQVPTNLTAQQKDALLAYAEAMGEGLPAPTPVKDFFKRRRINKQEDESGLLSSSV